jgi:hypothetical protein
MSFDLLADLHRLVATRFESAAGREIRGRRNPPFDGLQGLLPLSGGRERVEQLHRVWVGRTPEDLFQTALLYDPARVHHAHAVRILRHHTEVVGDE